MLKSHRNPLKAPEKYGEESRMARFRTPAIPDREATPDQQTGSGSEVPSPSRHGEPGADAVTAEADLAPLARLERVTRMTPSRFLEAFNEPKWHTAAEIVERLDALTYFDAEFNRRGMASKLTHIPEAVAALVDRDGWPRVAIAVIELVYGIAAKSEPTLCIRGGDGSEGVPDGQVECLTRASVGGS